MSKFQYKFASIKRVKKTLEKKAQKEVALIEIEIEKQINEYENVEEEEKKFKLKPQKKHLTIAEMKYQGGYLNSLARKKEEIQKRIDKLNKQKELKLTELVQKSKDHKIFNTLEENYLKEFELEQNKIEAGFIDEIATQKFIRNKK